MEAEAGRGRGETDRVKCSPKRLETMHHRKNKCFLVTYAAKLTFGVSPREKNRRRKEHILFFNEDRGGRSTTTLASSLEFPIVSLQRHTWMFVV